MGGCLPFEQLSFSFDLWLDLTYTVQHQASSARAGDKGPQVTVCGHSAFV